MSNDNDLPPQSPQNNASSTEKDRISFSELSRGKREVLLEHEGQLYRLRLTRNGKLILNK
ncbi:MAG TPA: hemin uptake protein HemP [Planctomycetaceae bacterium]|nr:hemin uptake protein HemP [Planctomycetaceae bacterium]